MDSLEGQAAPAFSREGSDGQVYSRDGLRGQRVVLYFYPKDDTPGCTKEACGIRDRYEALQAHGIRIFGVSPDDAESHRRFIEKYGLPFVLLSDPDRSMMRAYHAFGEKNMYGKIVEGVIRSTVVLDAEGTIVKHWKRVRKAETHVEDILGYLEG